MKDWGKSGVPRVIRVRMAIGGGGKQYVQARKGRLVTRPEELLRMEERGKTCKSNAGMWQSWKKGVGEETGL